MIRYPKHMRGFTFVELLVTVAVIALVFGGLMASIQFITNLISTTKVKTSAIALANERIEYIRSLNYDDIGTIAGIPNGLIPQNATATMNGFTFHERVVVQYVDAPDDGLGAGDSNGILADFKEVKVEYSWADTNGTTTIFLLTNVVPPGIESTDGGGTLTVNVFDAGVLPVSGAEVHIYNDTTTSTIDTIRYTNSDGIAMFAGAPAAANYEITVSKSGYSTDGTYTATTSNPSPITPPVAVIESAVSTMNFQIDELSTLNVRTIGEPTTNTLTDTYTDASNVSSSSDIVIGGGEVVLSGSLGSYVSNGYIFSATQTPATISRWDSISWDEVTPASTDIVVQVYTLSGTSTYVLVPESDLPGNAIGFNGGTINISTLDGATYPALVLRAQLSSSDMLVTPTLQEWTMSYVISEPAVGSIPFTIHGNKTIGTTALFAPIYKHESSYTTDGSGEYSITNLEWDVYSLTLDTGAYNIKEACQALPYTLLPGVSDTLTLTLVSSSAYSMRVHVVDSDGDAVIGADVELSRGAFSDTMTTSTCGQAYFHTGLSSANDYQVEVSATGYTTQTITDVTIDDEDTLLVTLISS